MTMIEIIDDLQAQHDELRSLIATIGEGASEPANSNTTWHSATPCVGWDIADVLLHLAATDELAISSVRGDLDHMTTGFVSMERNRDQTVDDAAAAQVESERILGGATIARRWNDSAIALVEAFRQGDQHRRVTWVAGKLSMHTLAATRLSETWIHSNDIAAALGKNLAPTNRLRHIARLAWRTIPYAFEMAQRELHGGVAVQLVAPSGETWMYSPDGPVVTTISGTAIDFCNVAARRLTPQQTNLSGNGPDVDCVLNLVRTYAI